MGVPNTILVIERQHIFERYLAALSELELAHRILEAHIKDNVHVIPNDENVEIPDIPYASIGRVITHIRSIQIDLGMFRVIAKEPGNEAYDAKSLKDSIFKSGFPWDKTLRIDNDEIGTIWFEREHPDKLSYVLGIYLNRVDLFGKRIGGKVIKSAMDTILSEKDVRGLYLDVRKENIRAIRCYEKFGFKAIYEGEKVTSSGKINFQRMRLLSAERDNRTRRLTRRRENRGFS